MFVWEREIEWRDIGTLQSEAKKNITRQIFLAWHIFLCAPTRIHALTHTTCDCTLSRYLWTLRSKYKDEHSFFFCCLSIRHSSLTIFSTFDSLRSLHLLLFRLPFLFYILTVQCFDVISYFRCFPLMPDQFSLLSF